MSIQAKWGPLSFVVSPSQITSISGLSTSYALKTDVNEDTSGTPPVNTKGRELQPVSITVSYLRAAGVDPRNQMAQWAAQVGNSYPLYLGGRVFGPPKLQLQNVDVAEIRLNNSGEILSCDLTLSFLEYSPTTYSNAATSSVKAATPSKSAALNATASKSDKTTKKASATGAYWTYRTAR